MKNTLFFTLIIGLLCSCGPHLYKTHSAGQDNSSYIVVLREAQSYDDVIVVVDDKSYKVDKVQKVKAMRKAHPIVIEPGKHSIQVSANGKIIVNENIFIGLQETKKIILE